MNYTELAKPETDRINILRKSDYDAGTMMADIADFLTKKDYRRALMAIAYLMVYVAKQGKLSANKALKEAK